MCVGVWVTMATGKYGEERLVDCEICVSKQSFFKKQNQKKNRRRKSNFSSVHTVIMYPT